MQYFNIKYYRHSWYKLPSDTNILPELHMVNQLHMCEFYVHGTVHP